MSFHSRFHHTHDWALPFFSLYAICCVHSRIFFSLCVSLSLTHSVSLFIYLSSIALCTCACVCVLVYVRFHFFWLLQHVIKFFFSRPAMKHDSPQICAMIRSISVAAVAPNRISMHHDATMVSPINQQPIVQFFFCTLSMHIRKTFAHVTLARHVRMCACACACINANGFLCNQKKMNWQ